MEVACLAIFGCVGYDLVKHVVEISHGYIVVSGGSEVEKRV